MASTGLYTIEVNAILNTAMINSQLAALQAKVNSGAVMGGAGAVGAVGGKGAKGTKGAINQVSKGAQSATKNIQGAVKQTGKLGMSLGTVAKKVVAFGAVTSVIQAGTAAIGDMIHNVFELDSALKEYKKVTNLTEEGVANMTNQAFELGRTVSRTGTEMIDAATQFKRSGFTDEESLQLGKFALMYKNIADEEVDAGEAAGFITAQIKAFNMEASDAEHIIDVVNEVSNNFAVSSADIATNVGKASSAMAVGNVTYEQTVGMLTAITEITRNASTSAQALVKIQSRYNQIIDASSSTGKKLTAWYKEHNIAIKDQNGQLLSIYDVTGKVAKIWDKLSDNERKYYLNTQAGAHQSQRLAALLSNYNKAVEATNTGLNANNSAMKSNENYQKSLEGHVEDLTSAWENFSRKLVDSDAIKGVLSTLTVMMDALSTETGQLAVEVGLAVGALTLLGKAEKALVASKLVGTLTTLGTRLKTAYVGAATFGGATTVLGKSATGAGASLKALGRAIPLSGIFTFAGATGAVAYAVYKVIKILNEADVKAFKKTTKNIKNINNQLDKAKDKLEIYRKKAKEASQAGDDKQANIYKKSADEMERRVKLLERQLELQKQIAKEQFAKKESKTTLHKYDGGESVTTYNKGQEALYQYNKAVDKVREAELKLSKAQQEVNALEREGKQGTSEYEYAVNKLEQAQKNSEYALKEYDKSQGKVNKKLEDYNKYGVDGITQGKKTLKLLKQTVDGMGDVDKSITDMVGSYDKLLKKGTKGTLIDPKNIKKTVKQIKSLGDIFGVVVNEAGKVNEVDVDDFIEGIEDVGGTVAEAEEILRRIAKSNPKIKLTVDGEAFKGSVEDAVAKSTGSRVLKQQADDLKALSKQLSTPSEKQVKVDQDQYNKTMSQLKKIRDYDLGTSKKTVEIVPTGASFAKGSLNTQVGNAMVNEQGFEIIESPNGTMRVANGGKRGVTYLEQGSAVYTHGQSMRMLGKAGITQADLLQGKKGDVGVVGVNRLEGFAKGKTRQEKYNDARDKLREKYDNAVENAEFLKEKNNYTEKWLIKRLKKIKADYLKKLKKLNKSYSGVTVSTGLGRDRRMDYETTLAEYKREYGASGLKYLKGTPEYQIEKNMELFENEKKTYSQMKKILQKYFKAGKITAKDYYDYLQDLDDEMKDRAQEDIDTNMELFASQRITYEKMSKIVKDYYKKGKISKKEYNEYIKEINSQQVDNVSQNYQNQWDYISQYIQRQIDLEEKNNDVLQAQSDLLSATTQKVKVYKEGVGFVYEADEQAVRDAQENLKSYSSVWQQIQDVMSDVESQLSLQEASKLVGEGLLGEIAKAGTDLTKWSNIIGLVGANTWGYDLASILGITNPKDIKSIDTINNQTLNISNISLPNVVDAKSFVDGLQSLAFQMGGK